LVAREDGFGRVSLYPLALGSSRDTELAAQVLAAARKGLPAAEVGNAERAVESVQRNAWAYEALEQGLGSGAAKSASPKR
jgi:hypothetical protein